MSTSLALHDPIVRTYALLIAGALVLAGAVLCLLTHVAKKPVPSIWATYRGWLVIVPVVFGALLLGRTATIIVFSLVALAAFKELACATGLYRDWWLTGLVYVAIAAQAYLAWIHDPYTGQLGWFGMFRTLPVYAIAAILMVPIVRNRTQGQLQGVSLAILGYLYVAWMFGHLLFLANSDRPYAYLLYLIVAVELGDVAAFTFGKLFGRHKLRSEISPGKTWEGSLGALAVSMALPWLLAFSFPHFSAREKILTGLIVGIGGQLGDLSISVIKRDLGIKDMGAALPGHGGILDRIDSLIYTAPLFLHMVHWFHGLYGVR
jgi:phosphatidate cytidylyltransferase